MKLKYYLRGLGIGILVTAVVLSIAGDSEDLTDAEIRARARELGMVEQGDMVLSSLTATTAASEPAASESAEEVETQTSTGTEKIPETQETAGDEETPESQGIAETEEPQASTGAEKTEPQGTAETEEPQAFTGAEKTPETQNATETVIITIRSGASSTSVSEDLEKAGLVEDAGKYDSYLCDNGYSRVISVGTYEIPLNSSEEEIAKIITRKK